MEQKLAKIYSKLAEKIIDNIPISWDEVYYLGIVNNGGGSYSSVFYFLDSETKKFIRSYNIIDFKDVDIKKFDSLHSDLNKILIELYKEFELNEQELWDSVEFYLNNSGKFKIEFKYDVINETANEELSKEVIWAYERLNYRFKGKFHEKILNEYLKEKLNNKE